MSNFIDYLCVFLWPQSQGTTILKGLRSLPAIACRATAGHGKQLKHKHRCVICAGC